MDRTLNGISFSLSEGWQPKDSIVSDALTNASLNGTLTTRPPGLTEISIVVNVTALAGASVTWIVEGTNDGGTNYHTIHQAANPTSATGVITLGLNSSIDLQRWTAFRVRAVNAAGTFTAAVVASGFPKPGQAHSQTDSFSRTADPTSGTAFVRRGGTRFGTVQVVMTGLVLGAATSVDVNLQGSADGGTTWVNIATANAFTANGSAQLQQSESVLIDLGGFNNFRFQAVDNGGASTDYTVTAYLATDGTDWLVYDAGSARSEDFNVTNCILDVVSVGAEVANQIPVALQVLKADGSPLAAVRAVALVVGDTQFAGEFDLSGSATINGTAVTGTVVAGGGTNVALVNTDAAGALAVNVDEAGALTCYLTGGTSMIYPKASPFVIAQAGEATCVFV